MRPLDRKSCVELVGNLMKSGDVPRGIMEPIVERAGGNPFFVEEIIRACIDDDFVEIRDDGFRATGRLQSFVVPATVNEVIMSRFDSLDEASRELLRVASVIGRSFYYRLLAHIARGIGNIHEDRCLRGDADHLGKWWGGGEGVLVHARPGAGSHLRFDPPAGKEGFAPPRGEGDRGDLLG